MSDVVNSSYLINATPKETLFRGSIVLFLEDSTQQHPTMFLPAYLIMSDTGRVTWIRLDKEEKKQLSALS